MKFLKGLLRWMLACSLALTALGTMIDGGSILGGLIALAGSVVVSPPGGAWVGRKIKVLDLGVRQVIAGFGLFFVGFTIWVNSAGSIGTSSRLERALTDEDHAATTPQFECESGTAAEGQIVDVIGAAGHDLHAAPAGERIINQKATQVLGEEHYQSIDNSTQVQVQCIDGDWARIQITSPEWLTDNKGWVPSAALALALKPGESREFTDVDFLWDEDTSKEKAAIIKAVNRIHREDPRCDKIFPGSVARAALESQEQGKTMFFVNCGEGSQSVNVYFDAKRANDPTPFRAPRHIDKGEAIGLCERYAKQRAANPSTVEFSKFMDLAISEHPDGRTTVMSSFRARNAFNLELKFRIQCVLDKSGLIDGAIAEDGA